MMFNSDLFFFLGIGAAGIQKSAGSALHEILSLLIRTWRDSHAIIQAINSHRQGCPRSAIAKLLDRIPFPPISHSKLRLQFATAAFEMSEYVMKLPFSSHTHFKL